MGNIWNFGFVRTRAVMEENGRGVGGGEERESFVNRTRERGPSHPTLCLINKPLSQTVDPSPDMEGGRVAWWVAGYFNSIQIMVFFQKQCNVWKSRVGFRSTQ